MAYRYARNADRFSNYREITARMERMNEGRY